MACDTMVYYYHRVFPWRGLWILVSWFILYFILATNCDCEFWSLLLFTVDCALNSQLLGYCIGRYYGSHQESRWLRPLAFANFRRWPTRAEAFLSLPWTSHCLPIPLSSRSIDSSTLRQLAREQGLLERWLRHPHRLRVCEWHSSRRTGRGEYLLYAPYTHSDFKAVRSNPDERPRISWRLSCPFNAH